MTARQLVAMRTLIVTVLAGVTLLTSASPATAAFRTIQQDVDVANAYWGLDANRPVDAPGALPADRCAVTGWDVQADETLDDRGYRGEATGILFTFNHARAWDWSIRACEFTLNPAMTGCLREAVIVHEVGHFVHGPGHEGPMSDEALDARPCTIPVGDHVRTTPRRVHHRIDLGPTRATRTKAKRKGVKRAPILVRSRPATKADR